MNYSLYSFLFTLLVFCFSCSNKSNQNKNEIVIATPIEIPSLAHENGGPLSKAIDTLPKNKTNKQLSVSDWKVADFIVNDKHKSWTSVKLYIEYEIEAYKNVENPIIATYQGCDFGDYFHLIFEDAKGGIYDFGFGDNNYGSYSLFSDIDFADNKQYLGKSFKIYWDWKVTSFPCCDGDYDLIMAYLPSITKLELIEDVNN